MSKRASVIFIFVLIMGCGQTVNAQYSSVDNGADSTESSTTPKTVIVRNHRLTKGDNEFGFWGGGAFAATTAFGGLTKAEASDRKFIVAAFRYGRTLAANDKVALQYTLDVIPLAIATGDIVSSTTVGPLTTFRRETAYGGGLTPVGLQLDFANSSRIHPFIHVNGGGLIFNKPVPLPDAGRFALVGEAGGGVRIFTSGRRAITFGAKFHHISNGDRSGSNRGLNQIIAHAGFSLFK